MRVVVNIEDHPLFLPPNFDGVARGDRGAHPDGHAARPLSLVAEMPLSKAGDSSHRMDDRFQRVVKWTLTPCRAA